MKKLILPLLPLLLLSCTKESATSTLTTDQAQVTFTCQSPDITLTPFATRASLADGQVTDLYIFEGATLLAHQTSTDTNFGTPTVTLDYGSHSLTFIASKADGQSFDNAKWTCTSVKDTFVRTLTLTVSKGMDAQNVELSRANAKVQWTIRDAIPSTAATVTLSVGSYHSLTATLAAADSYTYLREDLDITAKQGSRDLTLSSQLLPAAYATESTTATTITFKDTEGNTIVSYSKDVPVLSNRVTNIQGEYFGTNGTGTISISSLDWLTPKDIDL